MKDDTKMPISRQQFTDFIERLINKGFDKEDWSKYIITHYFDDELENMRAQVAKLCVFNPLDAPETQSQLREWRKQLLNEE